MTGNPNEVPKYDPTPELLEQIYARSVEQQLQALGDAQREREWPHVVDQVLLALAEAVQALEARVAALETAGR